MNTSSPRVVWAVLVWLAGLCATVQGGTVALDAKDVALPDLVRMLSAQGGPTLRIHPDLQAEKVTFAAKAMSSWAALRWLCRMQNLVVEETREGRGLARPSNRQLVDKEYVVAKLVTDQEGADALVNFVKKVLFELHPIRGQGEGGAVEPVCEAVCEKGKLKVSAPPIVQREVVALLRAIAEVQPRRGMEDVQVPYQIHEVGFLGPRSSLAGPKPLGEVSLKISSATPAEAVWALTSAAKVSFFVDPWDPAMKSIRLTVEAEKRPLAEIVNEFAHQLNAERCWYDEAWLFVRNERLPLFEGLRVRAYNISSPWTERWGGPRPIRDLLRMVRGEGAGSFPFGLERFGDIVLLCGPADWHEPLEGFLKAAEEFRPPPRRDPGRIPGPGRGPGGRGRG